VVIFVPTPTIVCNDSTYVVLDHYHRLRDRILHVKCPPSTIERGMTGCNIPMLILREGTKQSERDGTKLIMVRFCMCGAKAQHTVLWQGIIRFGGLECVHSDGDQDVLRRSLNDGVMEERFFGYGDSGYGAAVCGVERGRGNGMWMGGEAGKCKCPDKSVASGGFGAERTS